MKNTNISVVAKGQIVKQLDIDLTSASIKAVPNMDIILKSKATGKAPKQIKATRKGDDLVLSADDSDVTLTIEDYYQNKDVGIYGVQDGGVASYHLNSSNVAIAGLDSSVATTYYLDNVVKTVGSFNPYLLGGLGAVVAGVALAGGGGSDDAPSAPTPPPPPTPTPQNAVVSTLAGNNAVDEGESFALTVTLDNANGNPSVPFVLSGVATDDYGNLTFSNGVTQNTDGTLKVPQGVTEFTVTLPITADNQTEGSETLTVKVGGQEKEVIINDTSTTPVTPPPPPPTPTPAQVANIETSANINEGETLTLKVTLDNANGAENVAFALSGVATDDYGALTFSNNSITQNTDGTLKVPQGVTEFTVTLPIIADNQTEGSEILTVKVGGQEKEVTINDTSTTPVTPPPPPPTPTPAQVASIEASANINEGETLTATVKLDNANGNDKLAFTLAGLETEDYTNLVFGNDVTRNNDDTLNVPNNVQQFTVSLNIVADNATEGEQTLTLTAGNKSAEVKVLDTSLTPPPPKASVESVDIKGTADEGETLTATVKLDNANGNDKLAFTLAGLETEDYTNLVFGNGVTRNNDGTLNVPDNVQQFTVSLNIVADKETEGEQILTLGFGGIEKRVVIKDTSVAPPLEVTLSTLTVVENDIGVVIGDVATKNGKTGDTYTYTVNDNRFEVVNGQLKLKSGQMLDYETETTISLVITSTNQNNVATNNTFTLNVQDVDDSGYVWGTDGKDSLQGTEQDEILVGRKDDDTLKGGEGDDTYIFYKGDGRDTVHDSMWGGGKIVFKDTVLSEVDSVELHNDGGVEYLTINYTNQDSVTLNEVTLPSGEFKDYTLQFADGASFTLNDFFRQDIDIIVTGTNNPDVLYGTPGNDSVLGEKGDDTLIGFGGHDTYVLHKGDGHDVIQDYANNITPDIEYKSSSTIQFVDVNFDDIRAISIQQDSVNGITIQYGEQDSVTLKENEPQHNLSKVVFADGTSMTINELLQAIPAIVTGTDGDDEIVFGTKGDDVIVGGKGDDLLFDGREGGSDTYVFNAGDGNDEVVDFTTDNKFAFNDINSTDVTFSHRKGNVTIHYGNGDSVTFNPNAVDTIKFKDTEWDISNSSGKLGIPYWNSALVYNMVDFPSVLDTNGDGEVFFSFLTYDKLGEYSERWSQFTDKQKDITRQIFRDLAEFLPIKFTEHPTDDKTEDIIYLQNADLPGNGVAGLGGPDGKGGGVLWIDSDYIDDENYLSHVIAHELGHTFGLHHPRAYGGEEEEHGKNHRELDEREDRGDLSIMSYLPPESPTFQDLDISALQYLYGVNPNARPDNDIYGFDSTKGVFVWDGAGEHDVIDASSATDNVYINLNAGTHSYLGVKSAYISDANQLTINHGTVIEDAIGGQGNDTLIGNSEDNRFAGVAGNDTLTGGLGRDAFVYDYSDAVNANHATGNNGRDTITDFTVGNIANNANADLIELTDLLKDYNDDQSTLSNYLSIQQTGNDSVLSIDRDGAGTTYAMTELLVLQGVSVSLETLVDNGQII